MKRLLFYIIAFMAVVSCARMGSPDGGWYDDDPPRILGSEPAEQAVNVTGKKISIFFDEYIKLDNPTQNVIISPPQMEMPEVAEKGKKIVVELKDTLIPNTTYTIDFGDAISDNNEGNPMGNYTFTFSTGEVIDTFEVAGFVLDASNLEPVKGISVGLYRNLADSAFRTKPMERVSRTDDRGHFVIKGVAPGEYRIYALQDADNDFRFTQKSEMIAFSHETYKPSSGPDIRQDTIWRDSLHIDNIIRVPFTHFYPDDVVLMAFQEEQTNRYLIKTERKEPDRINFFFSYGDKELPVIEGLNFNADSAFVIEANAKKDTLTYWLRDTTLINQDTLRMNLSYMLTDSLGQLVQHTDSAIEVLPKIAYERRMKMHKKEVEEWQKEQEKRKKKEEPYDSIYPVNPLAPKYNIPQTVTPKSIVLIEIPSPLASLDTAAIHLYSKIDTLWYKTPFDFCQHDSLLRFYEIRADWQPGTEYSLEVDSAAFKDIYGLVSNVYKQGIKAKPLENFATIKMQLSGIQDSAVIVQLLDKSDKMVRETPMDKDNVAYFDFVQPGSYYMRAFVDRNGNGLWDTGLYDEDVQPEEVYYYYRNIEAKEKYDIKLSWNLSQRKRNEQKPGEIVKQKADKQKKRQKNRNAERAKSLGIEYVKKNI